VCCFFAVQFERQGAKSRSWWKNRIEDEHEDDDDLTGFMIALRCAEVIGSMPLYYKREARIENISRGAKVVKNSQKAVRFLAELNGRTWNFLPVGCCCMGLVLSFFAGD
jgi:hypothetical protein